LIYNELQISRQRRTNFCIKKYTPQYIVVYCWRKNIFKDFFGYTPEIQYLQGFLMIRFNKKLRNPCISYILGRKPLILDMKICENCFFLCTSTVMKDALCFYVWGAIKF